jgi:3-oxoacyl-[acyl-carrier-protein] synthase-3
MSFFKPKHEIFFQGPYTHLPSVEMSNDKLAEWIDADIKPSWFERRTGILNRYWVQEDESLSDLAFKVAEKILEDYAPGKGQIQQLILATISGDFPSPPTAPLLQNRLGLPHHVGCFDLGAACSGFVTGLITASQLCTAGVVPILLIAADIRSKFLSKRDLSATSLFGDGAAGGIISNDKKGADFKFLAGEMLSDGSVADIISIPAGGTRLPHYKNDDPKNQFLKMKKGATLFVKAVDGMVKSAQSLINALDIPLEQIDWVVPHQANLHMIDEVIRKLDLPQERVIKIVQNTGNTAGASTGLALSHLKTEKELKPGKKILLVSAGGGGLSACALLESI